MNTDDWQTRNDDLEERSNISSLILVIFGARNFYPYRVFGTPTVPFSIKWTLEQISIKFGTYFFEKKLF